MKLRLMRDIANGFIIDTLNDSIHDLPEEGWAMLDPFFHPANELHV